MEIKLFYIILKVIKECSSLFDKIVFLQTSGGLIEVKL